MGSGKSTTATSIALGLQHANASYRYWWEGERPHPIRVQKEGDGRDLSVEELIERGLAKWARFVDWCSQSQTIAVLDGLLFQMSVTDLLKQDATFDEVVSYIRQVSELTKPLNPRLVYFRQEDLKAALLRVADLRGRDWLDLHIGYKCDTPIGHRLGLHGFEGLVQFSELYCEWTDALFDGMELQKLKIENSAGDWSEYTRQIEEFIGIDLQRGQAGNRHLSDRDGMAATVIQIDNRTGRHLAAYRWPYKKSQALMDFEICPWESLRISSALSHRYRFQDVYLGEVIQDAIIWDRGQTVTIRPTSITSM